MPKPKQERKFIRHPSCSVKNYGCHKPTLPNLLRALNERVFNVVGPKGEIAPTPAAAAGVWMRLDGTSKLLARKVRESLPHVQRLTVDEFVEQCPAQKRAIYVQAGQEYLQRGVGPRDSKLRAFVKFEKILFEKSGPKADPCPRLIQPRSPVYNVALGRYTRRVEKELYTALRDVWVAEEGEEIVMKGMTVVEVASQLRRKWEFFRDPVAVGLDASRFDQHIGEEALEFEHSIYERVYKDSPDFGELRWLLEQQRNNRGSAFLDGFRVDYEIKGTRASGDMNTGLGNCLIMSSLVHRYVVERGVKAKLANNGDDCLVFMERADLQRFSDGLKEWFLVYGLNMKAEDPSYAFEECEFCQMRPVWSGSEWVMVRNPYSAISKDTMALGFTEREYLQWVRAVGTCGMALYGDMPLFSALYHNMSKSGIKSNVHRTNIALNSGWIYWHQLRGRVTKTAIDNSCRISFAKAFNISPQRQIEIEDALKALSFNGCVDASLGDEHCLFC